MTCYAGGNVNSTTTPTRKGGDLLETSLQILPNSPDPGKAGQSPQKLPALGDSLARDYFISATVKKLEAFECFSLMDLKKILGL